MTPDKEPIAEIPLISFLPEAQRELVVRAGRERSLKRGEVLFHEGDPAEALFAVTAGQMKLVRYSPRGKEMLLHLVHPGQTFADAALFGEQTYPATAVAVAPTCLWCLSRQRLERLIRSSPELGVAMVASVSLWTRRLAAKLELLTQRRVEERLAIYLLSRSESDAVKAGDAVELGEPRNLIAAQIGTGPEVLSRCFRRLEDEGLLAAEADRVRILAPDRLRALAEWID